MIGRWTDEQTKRILDLLFMTALLYYILFFRFIVIVVVVNSLLLCVNWQEEIKWNSYITTVASALNRDISFQKSKINLNIS